MEPFYKVQNVPVHSVLLMNTKEEALNYPKRDLELGYCHHCGFIANVLFEAKIHEYSDKYEETQGFSETFNAFHHTLARHLVKKHGLYRKQILEIGCGKGEFITLLCELGENRGFGFDPAFIPERNPDKQNRVKFIRDYYSEQYSHYQADFICCKMTLEHIPDTYDFIHMVRRAIGENQKPIVFFQIPDASKILKDLGFWDIYYEHCSYFSMASLAHLFESAGFELLDIRTTYEGQYLTIEAKPESIRSIDEAAHFYKKEIVRDITFFKKHINNQLHKWKTFIDQKYKQGEKILLWGGGSKSVAFLTTLGIRDEIKYVVDINPFKQDTFLPGNGQKIIAPDELPHYKPNLIIVMNPIYTKEIKGELDRMELSATLLPVDLSRDQKVMQHQ